MQSFYQRRRRAISLKTSELGKKSQAARRARRLAAMDPVDLADQIANPPPAVGDAIGSIEIRNFRSGHVVHWTILRGKRSNNYILPSPDGRQSKAHGMAWITSHLRPLILHKI